MSIATNSFTADGVGPSIKKGAGKRLAYSLSGTFSATAKLKESKNGGQTWETLLSLGAAQDGEFTIDEAGHYRWEVESFASGTVVTALSEMPEVIDEYRNSAGEVVMRITDAGVEIPKGVDLGGSGVQFASRAVEDVVVFEGDSLFSTSAIEGRVDSLGVTTTHNVATGGNTTENILAQGANEVDSKFEAGKSNRVFVLIGVNDLLDASSRTAAATHENLKQWCLDRKAKGWAVSVLTLPLSDGLADATKVVDYNALIRANWTDYADEMIDVAADSRFQTATSSTWFNADNLHLSATGYDTLGDLINARYVTDNQAINVGEMVTTRVQSPSSATTYMDVLSGIIDFRANSSASLLFRVGNGGVFVNAGGHGALADFKVLSGNASTVLHVDPDADSNNGLLILDLPTSDPGVSGAVWNNSGVLNISA